MRVGVAIPLKYQNDHIEDAVLVYTSHSCVVYLAQQTEGSAPSFVKLEFERARCVRSARTDLSPALGIYPLDPQKSFLVELTDSNWANEAHRAFTYDGSTLKPHGRHFVLSNHDVFHEILADSFSESLVLKGETEHEFIKNYFV